jgi:hypothetical protein
MVIHAIKFCKAILVKNNLRALHQKIMSIQEFYYVMTDLWDQLTFTESVKLKTCSAYIDRREQ